MGLLWILSLASVHCLSPHLCLGGDRLCSALSSVPENVLSSLSPLAWSALLYSRPRVILVLQAGVYTRSFQFTSKQKKGHWSDVGALCLTSRVMTKNDALLEIQNMN